MGFIVSNFFYVIGLPRSRTLWLSFLLNDSESICYHEALTPFGSKELPLSEHKYIGSVDTNPLNNINYGKSPVAIIKRPIDDVVESIHDWFDIDDKELIKEYIEKYNKALSEKSNYVIDYEDLNDTDRVYELIKHLKPESSIEKKYIEHMQNCIIKTKNKNLKVALENTISFQGKESLSEVSKDKITVTRTLNISECLDVIDDKDIWDCVSEDGVVIGDCIPDVINEWWLSVKLNGETIGVCRVKSKYKKTCQGHIQILKKHRERHAVESTNLILNWIKENTENTVVIVEVPIIYPNVIDFSKRFGFEVSGIIKKAYTKNQENHDIIILSRGL